MKSVKPGRGPSMMNGIGALIAVAFGVLWTIIAFSMVRETPMDGFGFAAIFPLFGVLFIISGIVTAVYQFKNATQKNRFSAFDVTTGTEEADPLNQRFGNAVQTLVEGGRFCPYCGKQVAEDYKFCQNCGKELPQ